MYQSTYRIFLFLSPFLFNFTNLRWKLITRAEHVGLLFVPLRFPFRNGSSHTALRAVSHVIRPYFQMLTAAAAAAAVTAIAANSIAMRIIRVIEARLRTALAESGRGRKWDREYICIEEYARIFT